MSFEEYQKTKDYHDLFEKKEPVVDTEIKEEKSVLHYVQQKIPTN